MTLKPGLLHDVLYNISQHFTEVFRARRLSLIAVYNYDVNHALFWSVLKVDAPCSKVLCFASKRPCLLWGRGGELDLFEWVLVCWWAGCSQAEYS